MIKQVDKPKKPTKPFDIGLALVIGAAVFQAYHMGRAFHVYDPNGWHFQGVNIGGLILGAILNFIVAQAAVSLPSITATFASMKELLPKAQKKADKKDAMARARHLKKLWLAGKQSLYSQVGFYILISFSAMMVAPALFILWSATLPFDPFFIAAMALIGAVAPDVAITVGGFVSGRSVVSLRGNSLAEPTARSATQSVARPRKSDAGATDSPKSATESVGLSRTYPRRCEHCASDSPFGEIKSPNAVGGHMKKHHPELCEKKVKVSLAENLFSEVGK